MNLRKLTTSMLVALSLVGVASLFLGVIGFLAYRSHQRGLTEALSTGQALLADQLALSLQLPLWGFDRSQILKIIESTFQDRDVHAVVVRAQDPDSELYLRVRGDERTRVATAVPPELATLPLRQETRAIALRGDVIGSVSVYATSEHVEAELARTRITLTVTVAAIGVVLFLSLYTLMWRHVLHPLQQLARHARHPEKEAPPRLRGELEVLRQALEQRQLELTHALRVRDEFLIIASHELKTPITSLLLQLQLLRRGVKIDTGEVPPLPQLARGLDISNAQAKRLTRLIEDMLDISRMQAGRLTIQQQAFDLGELLHEVTDRAAADLAAAGCHLVLDLQPGLHVSWDRARIEQVLLNLIYNSVKYAKGTPVEVKAWQEGDLTSFSVRDFGPGIPEEKQPLIFDCFERGVATRNVAGLGLGLYISRRIVEAHQGSLHVKSVPGKGATFVANLPTVPIARATADLAPAAS
jgi:signal transduction histidine kinase